MVGGEGEKGRRSRRGGKESVNGLFLGGGMTFSF